MRFYNRLNMKKKINNVQESTLEPLNPSTLEPLKEGWRWVKLGKVCELIMGQSPPGSTYTDKPEGLPFFQGKADFGEYFPTVRVWCTQPIKIAEEGDILISVRAPVGPVNMNNLKCCIGRGLVAIRCKDDVINWSIFWYLRSIEAQISSLGSGSTFGAITRGDLISLQIPLPQIKEQKRIAAKLKELMQEVERARTACEKQLEAAKSLPAAYLREIFESEEAKKWERKRLGEVYEVCQYGLTATATNDKGFPYIRITDIDDLGNINIDGIKFVDCDENTHKKYALEKGDILFARSGSIGRTFLYNEIPPKAIFASYLIRFRLNQMLINPSWLFYYTHSVQYYQFIEEKKHTVSQPNINAEEYKSLSIPLPSLPVQQRIAAELKENMAEVDKLRTSIEKQLEAINVLPQAILRKAFRGEL